SSAAQPEVLDVEAKFSGYPAGPRASPTPARTPVRPGAMKASRPEMFPSLFGKPARLLTCECQRSGGTTMGQAFQLSSGPALHELLTASNNRIGRLLGSGKPSRDVIAGLYWSALIRAPTEVDTQAAPKYLDQFK